MPFSLLLDTAIPPLMHSMSIDVLRLIPIEPKFAPGVEAQQRASELFRSFLPLAAEVSAEITADVKFVDQGQNFRRVLCPFCNSALEIEWWRVAMDKAQASGFSHLAVTTPCCGASSSLNDLKYEWPAGFARFVLEAQDPKADLDEQQMQTLAQNIGMKLRKIWAHY